MTATTNFPVQAEAAKRAHDALVAGLRDAGFTVHEHSDVDAEVIMVHGETVVMCSAKQADELIAERLREYEQQNAGPRRPALLPPKFKGIAG